MLKSNFTITYLYLEGNMKFAGNVDRAIAEVIAFKEIYLCNAFSYLC